MNAPPRPPHLPRSSVLPCLVRRKFNLDMCKNPRFQLSLPKRWGMIKRGGTVAPDITCNAYHGKTQKDVMCKSKPFKGTARFDAYMTAHSAGREYDVPLDTRRVVIRYKLVNIMARMLQNMARSGMQPGLTLADRRFYSLVCMNYFQEYGIRYMMPAVKNRHIKKAVREHHASQRNAAFRFQIGSEGGAELPSSTCSWWKKTVVVRMMTLRTGMLRLPQTCHVVPRKNRWRFSRERTGKGG